ncbi:MAG TPA: DUF1801 domain-containing protein [Solirubrobacterales bacterium]|jgi:hypothetical protein|nr:DUF1801 domain-containing protein [Solirubrobacterales bacterium]
MPERAFKSGSPKLLAGGNPQIPKGDGDGPVQDYIAVMPEWRSEVGQQVDALVTATLPDVRKAVKWNSPLYGAGEEGFWFLGMHCFTNYVKVTFFEGAALDPPPPGTSKQQKVRSIDIREDDELDEDQFVEWVRQAARLPGIKM